MGARPGRRGASGPTGGGSGEMRMFSRGVAGALAGAMALDACQTPRTGPPNPWTAAAKLTFAYPIGKCPNGTTPDPSENYVITLGANFKLTNPDAGKSGHPQGKPKNPRPHPTQLDIVTDLLETGKIGTLTIVLDRKLNFVAHDIAFTGGDANAQSVFCGVTFSADGRSLTVTLRPVSARPYASYTLGLIADDND